MHDAKTGLVSVGPGFELYWPREFPYNWRELKPGDLILFDSADGPRMGEAIARYELGTLEGSGILNQSIGREASVDRRHCWYVALAGRTWYVTESSFMGSRTK